MSAVTPQALDAAVQALRAGELVVYPTETVYGLGAAALGASSVARLLALKGRPDEKGLSVWVSSLDAAASLLRDPPSADARALARAFWPGPLTIVLPAAHGVPEPLLGPTGGVGLRCSSDATAAALVAAFGEPITATSANASGMPPAADVASAHTYFGARVACYLDGGRREATSASTVVEFLNDRVILRRAGVITKQRVGTIVALHSSE